MQARAEPGRVFRQDWYAGHAEDTFSVEPLSARVRVPLGAFRHAQRTRETTALAPGVVDRKLYVRGIDEVSEASVTGAPEVLRLVEVIR